MLNRRDILRSIGCAALTPVIGFPKLSVPVVMTRKAFAVPVCLKASPPVFGVNSTTQKLWAKTLFDYTLENMVFTQCMGPESSIIFKE